MTWKERFLKLLDYAEHTDFITGWGIKLLTAAGLGSFMVWIMEHMIEQMASMSGSLRVTAWFLASAAIWGALSVLLRNARSSLAKFTSNTRVTTNIMFVLLIALGSWMWVISGRVSSVRDDVSCFVMPRHLADEQISKIAEYLSKHEPSEISLYQVEGDEEAGSYRADFYKALKDGGWKILVVHQVPQTQAHSDMFVQYTEPLQSSPPEEDPKHPRPHTLLEQAMRYAGVMNGGSASDQSAAFTKYSLSLTIGHRRRDSFACAEAINKHRQESLRRGLDD